MLSLPSTKSYSPAKLRNMALPARMGGSIKVQGCQPPSCAWWVPQLLLGTIRAPSLGGGVYSRMANPSTSGIACLPLERWQQQDLLEVCCMGTQTQAGSWEAWPPDLLPTIGIDRVFELTPLGPSSTKVQKQIIRPDGLQGPSQVWTL